MRAALKGQPTSDPIPVKSTTSRVDPKQGGTRAQAIARVAKYMANVEGRKAGE